MDTLGYHFIEGEHLPENENEYYIRDRELADRNQYRNLTTSEIDRLIANKNTSDNWNNVLVTNCFNSKLIKNCHFFGLIRIGDLEEVYLEHNDLTLPVGLYNSKIISCDFGNNVCVENVNYLSHYQIGNECILFNINEMVCSSHAKFGNGILKNGEEEETRIWLEVGNENGGRKVLPFEGMLSGDAFLWSKYRDDEKLMSQFLKFTQNRYDNLRGHYGEVGEGTVIKHCKILKDVKVGVQAYIKGANKLKNLTINSSIERKTQIGEGVEMVNGIIGYGCRAFYGVKAVRFIMGTNTNLKYGARLINSFLGSNATISCCEVLNALIFPGHEQHHNNSFLCAATIFGQSNIAAGATIGSNHNSRGNDGEIVAGRGFWPGLCVSLKHNSKFASFTLIAKGSYPAELNIKTPFSLIINDESEGRLKIFPGYWFLYNMYALARNSWKYGVRDKRIEKTQNLEFDYLAPDTINELFEGLSLIEEWVGKSSSNQQKEDVVVLGKRLLKEKSYCEKNKIFAFGIEASKRPVEVIKVYEGYHSLKEAIILYVTKVLVSFCEMEDIKSWKEIQAKLQGERNYNWSNIGGQLISDNDLNELKSTIRSGAISSWDEVHEKYKQIGDNYLLQKAQHAFGALSRIVEKEGETLSKGLFYSYLTQGVAINNKLATRTYESRSKDYEDSFRKMVYDNDNEMNAIIGSIDNNTFIQQINKEAETLESQVKQFQIHLSASI